MQSGNAELGIAVADASVRRCLLSEEISRLAQPPDSSYAEVEAAKKLISERYSEVEPVALLS